LAGYNDEMEAMIRSNPGLSSRINNKIEFEDYEPADLGRIFEGMCAQNQYQLPSEARYRVLVAFHALHQQRDKHFGNARLARNAFEDSVRRLADRVVDEMQMSEELLTQLTAADISMPGLTDQQLDRLVEQQHELRITCAGCERTVRLKPAALGKQVKCIKCSHVQLAAWARIKS
jgi:AAA lid domain